MGTRGVPVTDPSVELSATVRPSRPAGRVPDLRLSGPLRRGMNRQSLKPWRADLLDPALGHCRWASPGVGVRAAGGHPGSGLDASEDGAMLDVRERGAHAA